MGENTPITNLSEYLARVLQLREEWRSSPSQEVWFRGEGGDYGATKLKPGLYRPASDSDRMHDIDAVIEKEYDFFFDFQRDAEQFLTRDSYAQDKHWDTYFLMQHHGAPTRLLDWTIQPLLALFFAVSDAKASSEPRVFMLETNRMITALTDSVNEAEYIRRWRKYLRQIDRCSKVATSGKSVICRWMCMIASPFRCPDYRSFSIFTIARGESMRKAVGLLFLALRQIRWLINCAWNDSTVRLKRLSSRQTRLHESRTNLPILVLPLPSRFPTSTVLARQPPRNGEGGDDKNSNGG